MSLSTDISPPDERPAPLRQPGLSGLGQQVADMPREAIVAGEFAPGTRLIEEDLADRLACEPARFATRCGSSPTKGWSVSTIASAPSCRPTPKTRANCRACARCSSAS